MTEQQKALAKRIMETVPRIQRIIMENIRPDAKILPPAQFLILNMVKKNGRMPMSGIAREMHSSRPNVSNIIERMELAGLVKKTEDQSDKRFILLSLTKKGEDYLETMLDIATKKLSMALECLTEKESDEFLQSMNTISRLANKIQLRGDE